MNLDEFNQASAEEARRAIAHCVALTDWVEALVEARPFATLGALLVAGEQLADGWNVDDLVRALSAHPRIGERASGAGREAGLSRDEQRQVNTADDALTQALAAGNRAYEQRFGQVFLIRARGRSGEEILAELQRRLHNDAQQELREALAQLREITLLRLKESFQ